MVYTKYTLDPTSQHDLYIFLYKSVQNIQDLVTKAKSGQIECALMNPELIYDPFQLVVAANKAVMSRESGTLKTRNVYSEIIYNLSPSKNISKSLSTFGINEKCDDILLAILFKKGSELLFDNFLPDIKGEVVSINYIDKIKDIKSIEKNYDIKDNNMLNKIITIIATK